MKLPCFKRQIKLYRPKNQGEGGKNELWEMGEGTSPLFGLNA